MTAIAVVRSSGSAVLDEAARDLVRAAVLLAFPPGMPQSQIAVTMPVAYALDR